MRMPHKNCLLVLLVLLVLALPLSGAVPAGKIFMEDLSAFQEIRSADLIRTEMSRELVFVPGKPRKEWMTSPCDGIRAHFSGSLDLDTLTGKKNPPLSEGVVYLEILSPRAGAAAVGIGCDWWFEAFCNGRLCYSTMKLGNASGDSACSPRDNVFPIPVKAGKNLLAVRVRRGNTSWSFACGTLTGSEIALPLLEGKPWMGHPGEGERSISFRTFGRVGAGVEYREKGTEKWTLQWHSRLGQILRRSFHKVFLAGLKPGKQYEYRIVMVDPGTSAQLFRTKTCEFRMPSAEEESFHFVFTSDLQHPRAVRKTLYRDLLAAAKGEECDFFVFGGDIGSAFDPEFVMNTEFRALECAGASGKPVIFLRGNHETRGREADTFPDYFGTNDGKSFYLFRFGKTAFMVLDCWEDKPSGTNAGCKYNLDREFYDAQAAWFRKAVRTPQWMTAKRRIVFCHGAPWTHRGGGTRIMPSELRKLTDPEFRGKNPKSRVCLWLAGHTHTLARGIPGTDQIASEAKVTTDVSGKEYVYPVFTNAGPNRNKKRTNASIFRVDGDKDGIRVRTFNAKGECLEDILLPDKGGMIEKRSLPKFSCPGRLESL